MDAFTAGLVHEYLHGASLDLMNEVANLVGAWVASEVGAMPIPKRGALEHSLAENSLTRAAGFGTSLLLDPLDTSSLPASCTL